MHGSHRHRIPPRGLPGCLFVAGLLLAALPAAANGQVSPPPGASPAVAAEAVPAPLTPQHVQDRLKRLDDAKELDAVAKDKLRDIYKQALDQLRVAEEWASTAAKTDAARQHDPQEVARLKTELALPPSEAKVNILPDASLAQLEQSLGSVEEQLKAAQAKLAHWDAFPKRRREDAPRQVAAAKQRLAEYDQELTALPPASDALDLPQARRTLLAAMRVAAQRELDAHEQERLRFEANADRAPLERDKAVRDVALAEALVKKWRDAVNDFRRQQAEEQARQARWAAAYAHPELKALADENERLTAEQNGPNGLPAKIKEATSEEETLERELAQLRAQFASVQEKIKAAGLTEAMGLLLQKRQADLPDLREHRRNLRARRTEISRVQAKLIELEDERADLTLQDPNVQRHMRAIGEQGASGEREDIERALRELLENRRTYLDKQLADAKTYFNMLVLDLDMTERQLITETETYAQFINEKILWVRSAAAIGPGDMAHAWSAVARFIDSQGWRGVARSLREDAAANPLVYSAALALAVPLIVFQWRLRRRITLINQQTAQDYMATIGPTLVVLALTVLVAAIWPAVMLFCAWRLAAPVDASPLAHALAIALSTTAVVGLPAELLRQICRRKGLAEIHFRWPDAGLIVLRRNLRWLLSLGLPAAFVVALVEASDREPDKASLGRLAFVVGMLLLATFAHRVLRAKGGALHAIVDGGWVVRLSGAWHALGVGAPVVLLVVAALGYYYTALELAWRLQATLWVVLGLLILRALALRWLLVARRKLAIKQARQRRAVLQAQLQQAKAAGGGESQPAPPVAEDEVDLGTVDVQTRRLLRSFVGLAVIAGCWLIWVDVLPALAVLDQWKLWPYTAEATEMLSLPGGSLVAGGAGGTVAAGSGSAASPPAATAPSAPAGTPTSVTRIEWITVKDLIVCAVVVLMTIGASRNLPGLLEISVLQRLPLDPGGRYAITTLSRYLITLAGIVAAFWIIGIGWSNVQWLVAAVTVGLGFGLQEIFANFISGIIILFERPMRVGDIVTVGGVNGKVSRIRIRATTIVDWDRKELIVPNREFITGQLVNWTLSDSILRTVIRVGVAYGSDTELAQRLLLRVAHENEHVLDDPAPVAVLDAFGDSTLDFELRVFAPIEQFLTLRHDLNTAIDRAFRDCGIEIAFPQRDVHIRSVEGAITIAQRPAALNEPRSFGDAPAERGAA